jgi:hypothetical protein
MIVLAAQTAVFKGIVARSREGKRSPATIDRPVRGFGRVAGLGEFPDRHGSRRGTGGLRFVRH